MQCTLSAAGGVLLTTPDFHDKFDKHSAIYIYNDKFVSDS
jgi:hypothetical protein